MMIVEIGRLRIGANQRQKGTNEDDKNPSSKSPSAGMPALLSGARSEP